MMGVLATQFDPTQSGLQLVERVSWVPSIGLEWSLGVDGLSAPLVVLSGLVTLLSVWASWTIERKSRLYFALLLVQASAQGLVFLSQDFLLFFLAWELELVPVYLLIAIWGGQNRQYAATKFILYTAVASLLILISGLALALSGDVFTLNLSELISRSAGGSFGLLCYLGFLVGFGVKLPMFPSHTWLPDAHGEANAPGVDAAGWCTPENGRVCTSAFQRSNAARSAPNPCASPGDFGDREHRLRRTQRFCPRQRETAHCLQLR
jgi:NAD(P)H-quinone oxidoreductase subunit 4